jgi:hypothetical protein
MAKKFQMSACRRQSRRATTPPTVGGWGRCRPLERRVGQLVVLAGEGAALLVKSNFICSDSSRRRALPPTV